MKTTVKYTERPDGNGKPEKGFYVVVNGIAIGKGYKTYDAAYAALQLFRQDAYRQLPQR